MKKLLPTVMMSLLMVFAMTTVPIAHAQQQGPVGKTAKHKKVKGHIKGEKKLRKHHRSHHKMIDSKVANEVKKASSD